MSDSNADQRIWSSRFTEGSGDLVESFGASIDVDQRMAIEDIRGSIAHATMLRDQGILTADEAERILEGLEAIKVDIAAGRFTWKTSLEDVHMNIENELIARIGPAGGKLHTARSRNDQVATDLRLWLRGASGGIADGLQAVQVALVNQAERYLDVVMPGYTHLQVAQPVRLSHHLLAYYEMFTRDNERLAQAIERMDESPLGAGALAGTGIPINREQTASLLEFGGVANNSLDAVSDRDFALEFLAFCSIVMVHLSRLCEELILWSSQEFGFVTLPETHTTGSSIMPQKKNPDMCELIRGKTGRVCGSLMALLMTMKGLPLAYNKDMQEDKAGVFDAADTVRASLEIISTLLPGIVVHQDRMREAAGQAFSNATDLADYLARKGLPFRESHRIVGQLVAFCAQENLALESLPLARLQEASPLFEADVFKVLRLDSVVDVRQSLGGTARSQVENQIARAQKQLGLQ